MEKRVKNKNELIRELVESADDEMCDEDLIHMLLSQKVSANSMKKDSLGIGQKAADSVAKFVGSWAFIFLFLGIMLLWMIVNIALTSGAFDPYPFILLNLVLSCIAAVQAPLIMMSQNRQEAKDRERAENDYRVNLKNELVIADLHEKLDMILENQRRIEKRLSEKTEN